MHCQEYAADLTQLTIERCDELEEMAIRMAREVSHLKAMLQLATSGRSTRGDTHDAGTAAAKLRAEAAESS